MVSTYSVPIFRLNIVCFQNIPTGIFDAIFGLSENLKKR